MQEHNPLIDGLTNFIVEQTNELYKSGYALLLSSLGEHLREDEKYQSILSEAKLSEIISDNLSTKVQVISRPGKENIKALVPRHASLPNDLETLFPKQNKCVRYHPAIWKAFSRPLEDGFVRTIAFTPQIRFEDVSSSSIREKSSRKIVEQSDIVNQNETEKTKRDRIIASKITDWIGRNNVDESSVQVIPASDTREPQGYLRGNLFFQLTSNLTESELKRISIPLDIVVKLLNK